MSAAAGHRYLMQLLFDEDLRERFLAERAATLEEATSNGLDSASVAYFSRLDGTGLELDAAARRRYLMSALCRAYPLTAAVIGAAPGGARRLSAFLASIPDRDPGGRSAAFGDHLARLLDLNAWGAPSPAIHLCQAMLSLERAMVDNAAACREAIGAGRDVASARPPASTALKQKVLVLPPFSAIAVLPAPTHLITAALDGVGPGDAWHRIEGGALDFDRLVTVARADPTPVTVLTRAVPAGGGGELVEIRHLRVELRGRKDNWLIGVLGQQRLAQLAPGQRALASKLVEAGLLTA